jgi:hypothetical protein
MVFKLDNRKLDKYLANYKPFQVSVLAYGARGVRYGFVNSIPAMIDTGAKHTVFGKSVIEEILDKVKDERGNELKPQGYVLSQGVHGDAVSLPWYIIPNLCLMGETPTDIIRLTNVAVLALNSNNIECLIGRTILHQCILTTDPENDVIQFDFKDSLKTDKQMFCDSPVFDEVSLFAEF